MVLWLPFSNSLLIICGVIQRPVSKSMFANLITRLYSTSFHYRCNASLILASTVPGVTQLTIGSWQKTSPVIEWSSFTDFRAAFRHWGPMYLVVPKSSEFDVKSFCMHYLYLLQHQNCLATSDHATLGFYFLLAVLGSIGGKVGFTNFRRYCSIFTFCNIKIVWIHQIMRR